MPGDLARRRNRLVNRMNFGKHWPRALPSNNSLAKELPMRTSLLRLLAVGLATLPLHLPLAQAAEASTPTSTPAAPQTAGEATDWRETYAYSLGMQAYVFAFPWSYLSELRWAWTSQPVNPERTPYAPLNQFWNARHLVDAQYRDGGTPNNDTLYSIAWLDLKSEPQVLSVPASGSRYFVMQMSSMDSDNFASVGTRTTGNKAGNYLITGPGWHGDVPQGVQLLPASRTNSALIIGRTLVDGVDDLPTVHRIQDQYRLTPLSQWGQAQPEAPSLAAVAKPFDRQADALNEWRTINRALAENPPETRFAPLLRQFATIGVGPGMDIDALDAATQRGLRRAAVDGRNMLKGALRAGYGRQKQAGWAAPPDFYGRLGLHDNLLGRAAIQALGGIVANEIEEASYISTRTDADGQMLDGAANRYRIHFTAEQLPDVRAFWSMSIYDMTYNFAANPLDRFSIGNRTPGIRKDADGGLTLYLQADEPSDDQRPNWLPVPRGPFYSTFRAYIPGPSIVERKWFPPSITQVP